MVHDYCVPDIMETNTKGVKKTLQSPSKTPIPQKNQKGDRVALEGTYEEGSPNDVGLLLAAISALRDMMEDFKTELKQSTLTISNIAKAVEFNSAEIKDCKEKN